MSETPATHVRASATPGCSSPTPTLKLKLAMVAVAGGVPRKLAQPRVKQAPPTDPARVSVESAIFKIWSLPGTSPTVHDVAGSAACRKLAADAPDYLNLCVGYETKRKATMKAIGYLRTLEDLGDTEGDEADGIRDEATQYLDLYHPRSGEYNTKWIAAQIKNGFMQAPEPPEPPPEDPAVVAARAREERLKELAEIRKGPTFLFMNDFMDKHAHGPWPTHSRITGMPFKPYKPAAPAPGGPRPERTPEEIAASKAKITSDLQALTKRREEEELAAKKALEWDDQEAPAEVQQAVQSRFEKLQAAQKNAIDFDEESEVVFLQQAMYASYQTNDTNNVTSEVNHSAPTAGPARSCLRKRKSSYSDGEAGSSSDHAKMPRRSVAFEDDDEW